MAMCISEFMCGDHDGKLFHGDTQNSGYYADDHPEQCDLILPEDSPPLPQYLPRALSPEDDPLLLQELRRIDNLPTNALLLIRATGIRLGERIHLPWNGLRSLGQDQWRCLSPWASCTPSAWFPSMKTCGRL
jgi:hypothetical protein